MFRFLRALILLHRTYRTFPLGTRIHVFIRFFTCPFLRVLRHVSPGARVLEIGAGHAVFSRLALGAGAGTAVAVEPDIRKMAKVPGVDCVAGYDHAVAGEFDLVAMMDVLYAIDPREWDALLARIAKRVAPDGLFLLKEMDPGRRIKQRWNRLQESLSGNLLGITMAQGFFYEEPPKVIDRLRRAGFASVDTIPIDRGYPHPHILYVARKGR